MAPCCVVMMCVLLHLSYMTVYLPQRHAGLWTCLAQSAVPDCRSVCLILPRIRMRAFHLLRTIGSPLRYRTNHLTELHLTRRQPQPLDLHAMHHQGMH